MIRMTTLTRRIIKEDQPGAGSGSASLASRSQFPETAKDQVEDDLEHCIDSELLQFLDESHFSGRVSLRWKSITLELLGTIHAMENMKLMARSGPHMMQRGPAKTGECPHPLWAQWSSENIHFLQTFCRLCNARLAFLRKTPEEKFEALKEKLVETAKEKFKAPTVRTTDPISEQLLLNQGIGHEMVEGEGAVAAAAEMSKELRPPPGLSPMTNAERLRARRAYRVQRLLANASQPASQPISTQRHGLSMEELSIDTIRSSAQHRAFVVSSPGASGSQGLGS